MVRIGDRVTRVPETFGQLDDKSNKTKAPMKGTVVWVHPQERFHVVEFDAPGGKIRESFAGV